jgi:hypothetical protein
MACNRNANLPTAHHLLLQLAGCSSKALLWAGTAKDQDYDTDFQIADSEYWEAAIPELRRQLDSIRTSSSSGSATSSLVPVTRAAFLRPAVVLHWAWHYLQHSQEMLQDRSQPWALAVLAHSAEGFARIATARASRPAVTDVVGQPRGVAGAGTSSGLAFPVLIWLQILDDMLLLLPKMLTLLRPVAQQQPAQAASSSSNTGSGKAARSKGVSSSSSRKAAHEQGAQFDTALTSCLQGLLGLYAALSDSHMTEYAGLQPPQQQQQQHTPASRGSLICCSDPPSLPEDAAVWFQHAAQTCRVLEAYVRQMACSQAAGGNCTLLAAAAELSCAATQLIDPTEAGLHGPLLQAAVAAGPGGKEQQQLHGLLRSMLKWAGGMGPQQQLLAEQLRATVAVAAANMLLAAVKSHPQGSSAEPSDPQPAQHSMGAQEAAAATAVLPHLPWLGVLGCCCLQWSQQLASLPGSSAAAAESAARAAAGPAAAAASDATDAPHAGVAPRTSGVLQVLSQDNIHSWGVAVAPIWQGQSLVVVCVETARSWLGGLNSSLQGVGGEEIQSLGSGYAEPVLSAVAAADKCVGAWQDVQDSVRQHPDAPIPLAGYVQQLFDLGDALCAVAHKQSCNNPTCSNVSGPSELQLVKGRSNTCSGCRTARYCSPECMRQHWKQHRPVCKALARTGAEPAAASVGRVLEAAA